VFSYDSARSLHAALLRRIERLDPSLSIALHDAPRAAHAVIRQWTIANLEGPLERQAQCTIATPDGVYSTRVTALETPVSVALRRLLTQLQPVTLDLEHVPFDLVESQAESTTYRDLSSGAVANERIELVWRSPTALRHGSRYVVAPSPAACLTSYLRRWNAFADADLRLPEEPLLDFALNHLVVLDSELRVVVARPGAFRIAGSVGGSTWLCQSGPRELVRQVNLLVDYAFYCGTGVKTALGMGQTVRRPA
jgi:CRISPR-associated endoribonuclease Cas6